MKYHLCAPLDIVHLRPFYLLHLYPVDKNTRLNQNVPKYSGSGATGCCQF